MTIDCAAALSQKNRLDVLLLVHTAFATSAGVGALLVPHLFAVFLGEEMHGRIFRWNPDDGQTKLTHIVIRIYGALIVGQAVIVWNVRKCNDATIRRAIVQAYCIVFTLTATVLLRAHLTDDGFHPLNLLNIFIFALLAAFYGWFCMQPPPVFEGIDSMLK
eukprot:TRINITY_DN53905_c0_g1_i1.p2 TRINITY_DN53905_c0_g1~~TRINITY_DN53905_c0_g1_i1.p2  ORF type:complete len:161 (-),score=25.88 TRINITY_DN53905_c0_g1_i1:262-744(-)